MIYPYTERDRIDNPHKYMYTKYEGYSFLESYKNDRIYRLKKIIKGDLNSERNNLEEYLFAKSKEYLMDEALSLDSFDIDQSISLSDLIYSLLNNLIIKPCPNTFKWIDRLIQRFEVSKALYATYEKGFRKGVSKIENPDKYLLVALCLTLSYIRINNLQYISTLLKVNDLLLSLNPDTIRSFCDTKLLKVLIFFELNQIDKLATKCGI